MLAKDSLSEKKQLILERLKNARKKEGAIIGKEKRHGHAPLASAQKRLWFLEQLVPGLATYNLPMAYRLKGKLDVERLEKALNQVIDRHEILRTCFPILDGEPVQNILPNLSLTLPVWEATEAELSAIAQEEVSRPFDLKQPPLFRAKLVRLSAEDHVILVTMHHIISDGWSMGLIVKEFVTAYGGGELSPLPLQYSDYSKWQMEWLTEEIQSKQLAYWRNTLGGELTPLSLPQDRPRPLVASFRGGSHYFTLPADLVGRLKSVGRDVGGASLFMVTLAAFQALLSRYSGQKEVIVGTPVAGRGRPELESLIGFFVNTVALRVSLADNPPFQQLVARVRDLTLEALNHQDVPFDRIVEELKPERAMSVTPIFQAMFVLQNTPFDDEEPGELSVEPISVDTGTSKFDLWLSLIEEKGGVSATVEYNSDIFDPASIERLFAHYVRFLETVAARPTIPLKAISLLDENERRELVCDWNDTAKAGSGPRFLHRRFERAVAAHPDRIALVFEGQSLTYGELNARANRLARRLVAMGVRRNDVVGVSLERSLGLVVALYAIHKAGAGYLPLDPGYPKDRLQYLIDDSAVRLTCTADSLREWEAAAAGESGENLPESDGRDSLAYVIYTSGSTGRPKGVMVPHSAIVNRLEWMQDEYRLDESDRILQKTPFSFDVSVWEFFWPLLEGSRLVVAKPDGHKDPEYLAALIRREGITTMHFVPPMLEAFLESPSARECQSLRRVFCSGEELKLKTQQRFFEELAASELHNLYGPTEAAVDVTYWQADRATKLAYVPIGFPISNIQCHILDEEMRPVPIGVAGELYLGGVGLAWGYRNKPEMTARSFVPNPFSEGSRLYRTGDLAAYRPDRSIQFLGRIDSQVKIRGFRIETQEIESLLLEHAGLSQAAVVVREDTPGDKRLVAYLVPTPHADASPFAGEQVKNWENVFDETYQTSREADPTFDIVGWNSSYTGEPLPAEAMREWVDQTVERILRTMPKRVLEVGCGTGLLLFRLAPRCETYHGTDVSKEAIARLGRASKPANVTCEAREASDFDGIAPGSFDTVVINSVVQYFPSLDYLTEFLRKAQATVSDGGRIFVGDVRNHHLLEEFCRRVGGGRRPEDEKELVVTPDYFLSLRRRFPRITHVEIELKRGADVNELTQFRYDVTLHVGAMPAEVAWRAFSSVEQLTLEDGVGIAGIPNARLQTGGVDPESLWGWGESNGVRTEIRWHGTDGSFDVAFCKTSRPIRFPEPAELQIRASQPSLEKGRRALLGDVRSFLAKKLPEFMIPSAFVALTELPLSPNGKTDRSRLPAPPKTTAVSGYEAPRNDIEATLVGIWREVLGLEKIGIRDNFFELGGDSIKTIQVASRASKAGIKLSLKLMFLHKTVADLVENLGSRETPAAPAAAESTISQARLDEWKANPDVEDAYALSPLQIDQWRQLTTAHRPGLSVIWQLLPLYVPFDEALFTRTWQIIVDRYAALRTSFHWKAGELPIQVVSRRAKAPVDTVDLRGLTAEAQRVSIDEYIRAFREKGFDLHSPAQMQVTAFRLTDEETKVFWSFNYMIHDGWSTSFLVGDFVAIYGDLMEKREPKLSPVRPLGDYYEWLKTLSVESTRSFWSTRLTDANVTPLSESLGGKVAARFGYSKQVRQYSEETTARIVKFNLETQVTLASLVHGAWALLLRRYTGHQDVVFGSMFSGRPAEMEGVEAMVGHFNNLLPFRVKVEEKLSVVDWLRNVQLAHVDLHEFQHTPLFKIDEWSGLAGGKRLFQSYVVCENFPMPDNLKQAEKDDAIPDVIVPALAQLNFPLRIEIFPGRRLLTSMSHDHGVFDGEKIGLALESLEAMLARISSSPAAKVIELI